MKFLKTIILYLFSYQAMQSQEFVPCYSDLITTATYAQGGTGAYKNEIIWLTWGGKDAENPFGKPNQELQSGAKSYASIFLGEGKYLCLEAELIKIGNAVLESYRPGDYPGDSMDDWYNIGGNDANNKLICGIINREQGARTHFKVRIKSSINGNPVRLRGLIVGDAESTDPYEYIRCKADGVWSILDVKKNTSRGAYQIRKDPTNKVIQFGTGNDTNTAALAALKFNPSAFKVGSLEAEIEVSTKGSGKQAIAIGVLTPGIDLGDAPESYGDPLHTIEKLNLSADNTNYTNTFTGTLANGNWQYTNRVTNINTIAYTPAVIIPESPYFLGSVKPNSNTGPVHSLLANTDGLDINQPNEEDAWPSDRKRISYNSTYYQIGNELRIEIPYSSQTNAYITGWIDFDGDGKFGENRTENISLNTIGDIVSFNNSHFEFAAVKILPATNGRAQISWIIPSKIKYKTTYVRLRIGDQLHEISSPISNAIEGEVEDHRIIVLGPASTNPNIQNTTSK